MSSRPGFPRTQARDRMWAVSAPTAAAEAAHDHEALPIRGFRGTPEEIERQWYEKVYTGRGDRMPQLTWRAVVMGSLLGGVMSLTNLYIGLKTGWGFGVAITACILSYAIWTRAPSGAARAHAHDHPREQLHAVHRQLGGLSDGRHAHLGDRGVHAHHRPAPCLLDAARLGVLPGGPRGDHGHADEAPDDQRRAAPLPQRHRGGRDAARASFASATRACARRGRSHGRG